MSSGWIDTSQDAVTLAKSNLWNPGGTGSRIFGDNVAAKAVTGRGSNRNAHEKLANIQQKLQSKNLSNKKRKELKKSQRKLANDEKKRGSPRAGTVSCDEDETEIVMANIQTLTI